MKSPSSFEFHLPLSTIDLANNPPLSYLWVQDGCIAIAGLLWTTAYVLYIKQANKDKSYGMPLVALCANVGWELAYGIFYPLSYAETTTFIIWLTLDMGIIHATLKYGGVQLQSSSPSLARNLPLILGFGCVASLLLHYMFINTFVSLEEPAFWSGFTCQNLLGVLSVSQIMSRKNTGGHSLQIWLCRWIGSSLAIALFSWRYYYYPESYPAVASPVAIFMFILMEFVDLTYLLVYMNIGTQRITKTE